MAGGPDLERENAELRERVELLERTLERHVFAHHEGHGDLARIAEALEQFNAGNAEREPMTAPRVNAPSSEFRCVVCGGTELEPSIDSETGLPCLWLDPDHCDNPVCEDVWLGEIELTDDVRRWAAKVGGRIPGQQTLF